MTHIEKMRLQAALKAMAGAGLSAVCIRAQFWLAVPAPALSRSAAFFAQTRAERRRARSEEKLVVMYHCAGFAACPARVVVATVVLVAAPPLGAPFVRSSSRLLRKKSFALRFTSLLGSSSQ